MHVENTSETSYISFSPSIAQDGWLVKYSRENWEGFWTCKIAPGYTDVVEVMLDTTHKVLAFRKIFSYNPDKCDLLYYDESSGDTWRYITGTNSDDPLGDVVESYGRGVGDSALVGKDTLTSIDLQRVEVVGTNAFSGCTSL
jgi:hypothetical protein